MNPQPKYQAHRVGPGILHVAVEFYNGSVTRYACAMQLYASAWSRAKRKGQGIGSVLGYLRARADDKRQAVVREVIKPPTPYSERMKQELSVKPEPKGQPMEISVKTAELKKSLVAVCKSAQAKSSIPILSHVKLESTCLGLRLITTDLETSRMELIPYADGQASSIRWTSCVPALALKNLLPKSAADVKRAPEVQLMPSKFEGVEARYLTVCAAGGVVTLQTLPAEEFPTLPSMDNASEPVVWSGEAFRDLAEKVFPAISSEESRFQLAGARFELNGKARAISTDGHRLHCVDGELLVSSNEDRPGDWSTLVPRELLKQALADYRFKAFGRGKKRYSNAVHFSWSEHNVWLETYGVRYCARLLEGTFPKYENLFKIDPPCQIQTTGADLASTISAVEHCTSDLARAVRLELEHRHRYPHTKGEFPAFSARNPDKGEARAILNGSTMWGGRLENEKPAKPAVVKGKGAYDINTAREVNYEKDVEEFKVSGPVAEVQEIGINPDYLTDIANLVPGDLSMELWNVNNQILLTAPNFRSVIMPIRL